MISRTNVASVGWAVKSHKNLKLGFFAVPTEIETEFDVSSEGPSLVEKLVVGCIGRHGWPSLWINLDLDKKNVFMYVGNQYFSIYIVLI